MTKRNVDVTVTFRCVANGPVQDEGSVREALEGELDGITELYVQDAESDDETTYEVTYEVAQ